MRISRTKLLGIISDDGLSCFVIAILLRYLMIANRHRKLDCTTEDIVDTLKSMSDYKLEWLHKTISGVKRGENILLYFNPIAINLIQRPTGGELTFKLRIPSRVHKLEAYLYEFTRLTGYVPQHIGNYTYVVQLCEYNTKLINIDES